MSYIALIVVYIGTLGLENFVVSRTLTITAATQSTCQINFETINVHLMASPTNTNAVNNTFTSKTATDPVPLATIVASTAGGILGLCIIFICIMGILIKKKRKQSGVRRGLFTIQSLTSIFNR